MSRSSASSRPATEVSSRTARRIAVHRFINPQGLLPGRGFSHVAVPTGGQVVHVAGQTAHRADGTVQGDTVAEQAEAALADLVAALDAAGARPEHIVALQIFTTDVAAYRNSLEEIGPAWRRHLGKHYPAITLVGVTELFDPAAKIELVATAVIPG
jgi:enamine deaminase RidA (YjgF/YER057c/UK114 family)